MLIQNDRPTASNGGRSTSSSLDPETLTSLEFYGQSYEEPISTECQERTRTASILTEYAGRPCRRNCNSALEQIQRYSYQCNIKIIGLSETETHESASATTALCLSLFNAAGPEIFRQDIDIAHHIPTRNATPCQRLVICKFTRRVTKEKVMNARNDACKVQANSMGLPGEGPMEGIKLFHHLTPHVQRLLADVKRFQNRNGFRFCWSKNFIVYLRQSETSRPIPIKTQQDLEAFVQQEEGDYL